MTLDDLPAVQAIEQASFTSPWPADAYRNEILGNRMATYLVARAGDEVIGFAGIWLMVDEAHITTFAIHPGWRRRGIGERLLLTLLDVSITRHAREATLEVRLSNVAARRLYEKYGFRPVGVRPRYYTDDGEDALIMTTETLTGPDMQDRLAGLRATLLDEDHQATLEAAARRDTESRRDVETWRDETRRVGASTRDDEAGRSAGASVDTEAGE